MLNISIIYDIIFTVDFPIIKIKDVFMLPIILAIRDEEDQNFVSIVFDKYSDQLTAIAEKYLSNTVDVEDCIQNVFVILIKRLQEYQMWDERHQFNFLAKTCRCIAVNKYKNNQRRLKNEIGLNYSDNDKNIDIVDEDSLIEKIVISNENLKKLRDMIEDMDPTYGDILYLKGFLGMKNVDIAKTLDLSVDVLNMRLTRARKILLTTRWDDINEIRRK